MTFWRRGGGSAPLTASPIRCLVTSCTHPAWDSGWHSPAGMHLSPDPGLYWQGSVFLLRVGTAQLPVEWTLESRCLGSHPSQPVTSHGILG